MNAHRRPLLALAVLALLLPLALGTTGCEKDPIEVVDVYLPQISEDNVLHNFQVAYRRRDIVQYSKLLADDFQFYFDPVTRGELGIQFWTRTEDSLKTELLFTSPEVTKIAIDLKWPAKTAQPSNQLPPRDIWTYYVIRDVFLDVDFAPAGQEVTTFRVEDQFQRFFFRRGKSPTPAADDTLVYIVEWRDFGNEANSVSRVKAR
jgi:hypothetical protein